MAMVECLADSKVKFAAWYMI